MRALPTASPRLHHCDIAFEDGALFGVAERADDVVAQIVADTVGVPAGPGEQVLPSGSRSPACSAIDQQFFRGRSASNPRTNPRTRRRVSTRGNREAIRSNSPAVSASHRPASTLWPAATA